MGRNLGLNLEGGQAGEGVMVRDQTLAIFGSISGLYVGRQALTLFNKPETEFCPFANIDEVPGAAPALPCWSNFKAMLE